MKRLVGTMVLALLGAGCSSSTATDGGTTSGTTTGGVTAGTTTGGTGGTTTGGTAGSNQIVVTINTVDTLPPAKSWMMTNNLPIPDIYNGQYELLLNGVVLGSSGAELIVLGTLPLTSLTPPPPYTFIIDAGVDDGLGLLASIVALDAGTQALSCAQLALAMDGGTAALDGGYFDYVLPAGGQPGVPLQAPTSNVSGTVYALPASFVAQLSCAAGIESADGGLLGAGIALFYCTEQNYGLGAAVAGVGINNGTHGALYYYSNDFAAASQTGTTDATGVAVVAGIGNSGLPPSFPLTPPPGGPNWAPARAATQPGNVLEVFPYQP
jgi:hypothetical protein